MKSKIYTLFLGMAMIACNNPGESTDKKEDTNQSEELSTKPSTSEIVGQEVEYSVDGVKMNGYLAYDQNATEKRPGVLVVHEWWGHNEHTRNSARKLAEAGYVAMAVDMYGDGKNTEHPEDAKKFSGEVMQNFDAAKARFNTAKQLLESNQKTDPSKTAAIGYCFGGGVVLNMARQGSDLDAVVSIHGNLTPVEKAVPGSVKARILVLNGADDPFSPKEQREAFNSEMDAAGADYEIVNYVGAKHAFTNPKATQIGEEYNLPLEYNEEVAEKSWEKTLEFLDNTFKK